MLDSNRLVPIIVQKLLYTTGTWNVNNRTDLNVVFGVAGVVMMSFCVLKGGLRIHVGM